VDGHLLGQWKGKAIFDCLAELRKRRAGKRFGDEVWQFDHRDE